MTAAATTAPIIINGQVIFQFSFDLAWEIRIARLLKSNVYRKLGWQIKIDLETRGRSRIDTIARAVFEINSAELNPFHGLDLSSYNEAQKVTAVLDDSGALALEFVLSFSDLELSELVKASESFHENSQILENAKKIACKIQDAIRKFLIRPRADLLKTEDYEDYIIYRLLTGFGSDDIETHAIELASLIDGKRESLDINTNDATKDYATEVLQYRLSHPRAGLTIANWSGAICIGDTWDGVISIIRLANMELLELRLISEHLTRENDELDKLSAGWFYSLFKPNKWLSGSLLSRVLRTKREIKDQLGRIKNPLVRFGSPSLANIYRQLKDIFLIDYYMEEIKEELEELKDSESTIADRASARRQDVLAFLGVLVGFEYFTSGVSNLCKYLLSIIFGG